MNQPAVGPTLHKPPQPPERRARAERTKAPTLPPDASEQLLQQLTSELGQVCEPDALAAWAHQALPLKSQLSVADAQSLEGAFAAKLDQLSAARPVPGADRREAKVKKRPARPPQQVFPITKPVRERDRNHLRFVAAQPYLVCGRGPSDPHHLKFAEQRAMGRKVSDKFTVPVCRLHHRELHKRGDERIWWQKQGIDPLPVAATLWERTHAADSAETEPAGGTDRFTDPGGRRLTNGSGSPLPRQNDETNPILHPEAR